MSVARQACVHHGRAFLLQNDLRWARHFFRVLCRMVGFVASPSDFRPPRLRQIREEWPHIQKGQAWAALNHPQDVEVALLCSGYAIAGATRLPWLAQRREELRWLKAGLLAARQLYDVDAEGIHLDNLGYAYARRGNVRRAVVLFKFAMDIFRRTSNRQAEFQTLCDLGGAVRDLGNYDESLRFYNEALDVGRQSRDALDQVQALRHIGNLYQQRNDFGLAIDAFNKAFIIASDQNERFEANNALRSVFRLLDWITNNDSRIGEMRVVREALSRRDEILQVIKWENKLSDLPENPACRSGYSNRRRSGYQQLVEVLDYIGW